MSAAPRHRPERVGQLLKETLTDALATELKDPRVGFVTVTAVHMSPDCTHARVMVSVMGSEDEKTKAMDGLVSATGFLRSYIARNLSLRTAPELHFQLDRGLEHAARINRILAGLRGDKRT